MTVNWNEFIQSLMCLVVIPLLGILTKYIVLYISIKAEELKRRSNNETLDKYIEMAKNTVTECVIATNQTYVEALKGKDAFDADAQKEAFIKTLSAVCAILSEDAKEALATAYGDLNIYLTNLIESTVNANKETKNS